MDVDVRIVAAAKNLIENCMGTRRDEKLLIVTDEKIMPVACAFARAGRDLGHTTVLLEGDSQTKGEPNEIVASAMALADVEFLLTSMSYSHTAARAAASAQGARVASMPGMTREIALEFLDADYGEIKRVTDKLARLISDAKNVRVTSPAGTDLTFSVQERACIADTGILTEKGAMGNLPAGEAFIAPLEKSANGTFVCDTGDVIAYVGPVKDRVSMKLEDGYITDISGGVSAKALIGFLGDKDVESRGIAELGVGTNKKARLIGHPLVDEKVWGTVHIAFGTNKFMGGERVSNIHYDCVISNPTLILDGKAVIKDGKHIY